MSRTSIIYVNFYCEDLIQRSIAALKENPPEEMEIIIVNNGKSANFDQSTLSEDVRWIESPSNIGFGAACNLGASESRGDVFIFLNPDTIPSGAMIQALVQHIQNTPDCGACGPALYDTPKKRQINWNFHHLISWEIAEAFYLQGLWRGIFEKVMQKRHGWGSIWPVHFVSGACLAIPRKTFNSVNGFDPNFFLNYEDYEICERIRRRNLEIHYITNLSLIHEEGGTQRKNWGQYILHRIQGHAIYIDISYKGISKSLAQSLLIFSTSLRYAIGIFVLQGASRSRIKGYREGMKWCIKRWK